MTLALPSTLFICYLVLGHYSKYYLSVITVMDLSGISLVRHLNFNYEGKMESPPGYCGDDCIVAGVHPPTREEAPRGHFLAHDHTQLGGDGDFGGDSCITSYIIINGNLQAKVPRPVEHNIKIFKANT